MEAAKADLSEIPPEITREEAWRIFDEQSRQLLGMSAHEFIKQYDRGHWPDPDASGDVMYVAMLRQFAE